jgi:glyoxylase-like metal-dependent hydrolase (beta-lactamase superfamily II)
VNPSRTLDRRTFVVDLGRGSLALAVLGIAGCAPTAIGSAAPSRSLAASGSASPGASTSASPGATASGAPSTSAGPGTPAWSRVNLGFVSAYILVHGGEAAIVDTGVEGSGDAIAAALTGIGLDWPAVAHVILTHNHGDHAGSAADVLDRAADATGYAGAEDIAGITVPRPLTPVQDGDRVFDLQVVTAPGHTAGSIAVLDPATGGILVAGDALGTSGGAPSLPGSRFTADMEQAKASIVKLGNLSFETLLVGHGEPIESGAAALVAELGAGG